jgi:hypothetical protein
MTLNANTNQIGSHMPITPRLAVTGRLEIHG